MKVIFSAVFLFLIVVLAVSCHAQVRPSASRVINQIQVGVEYALYNSDYFSGDHSLNKSAATIFGDYRLSGKTRELGVEVFYHDLTESAADHRKQRSIFAGPRFAYRMGRLEPFGRAGLGVGHFYIDGSIPGQNGNHFALSYGGGLDIRVREWLVLRAVDFEQEHWSFSPNPLSPQTLGAGLAFRLP